ncbi:MAG: hypothetical protein KAW86_00680 [Bacteroidales bacterium]|nr:hypothetical protein [Bacteroidales bacterium]
MKKINKKPFVGIIAFLIVLFTMPIGHAAMILMEKIFGEEHVFTAAAILGLIGVILLIIGLKKRTETAGTFYGLFAGLFLWTGWVEFSFVFFARHLAVPPLIENGEIVTKPEYLILPSSVGLLLIVLLYFLFNNKTQCIFFRWLQRNLKMKFINRKKAEKDRPFAIITALEIMMILWFFYIVLLLVYDNRIFGDYHPATYIVCFGSLLWSIYLFIKLIRITKLAYAIRYAIPTVIIFWNVVEILGRWNFFREIWIEPTKYALEMSLILAVFVLLILISVFRKSDITKKIDG